MSADAQPLSLLLALALLSLLPMLFLSLTAFVKISTVLQIAKSALGAPHVPSHSVVMALSAALTLLAMAPVFERIAVRAQPLLEADLAPSALLLQGAEAAREPLREFLRANSNEQEIERFLQIAREADPQADIAAEHFRVLSPAFVVTELSEAFSVGFLLFLPFLVLDLLVANVLIALGAQALSPTQVSLPFKLLLFVAIDGWGLLAQALVTSYR